MSTFSISGNLGVAGAGATVIAVANLTGGPNVGFQPMLVPAVVADASGNYTISGLPANTTDMPNYIVTPMMFEKEFSPFSKSVVITTANVTGVNWTAALTSYAITETYNKFLYHGPLGFATVTGDASLTNSASAGAFASTDANTCGGYPLNSNFGPDCYVAMTVKNGNDQDITAIGLRWDATAAALGFDVEVAFQPGTGGAQWQLNDTTLNSELVSGLGFAGLYGTSNYTFGVGDKIMVLVKGTHVYLFHQLSGQTTWIPLGAGQSTNSPLAGRAGLEILGGGLPLSRTSWFQMQAGSVA